MGVRKKDMETLQERKRREGEIKASYVVEHRKECRWLMAQQIQGGQGSQDGALGRAILPGAGGDQSGSGKGKGKGKSKKGRGWK